MPLSKAVSVKLELIEACDNGSGDEKLTKIIDVQFSDIGEVDSLVDNMTGADDGL